MPTALKVIHGERRPGRINQAAPKPRGGRPRIPADLSPEARRVWRRQMAAMGDSGVITAADRDALRAYCEAVVRYEESVRLLLASGPVIRGARSGPCATCDHQATRHRGNRACSVEGCGCERLTGGELVKNPLHQIVRDNAMLIRLFGRELGFLPSAREGLRSPASSDDDAFDAWMDGSG